MVSAGKTGIRWVNTVFRVNLLEFQAGKECRGLVSESKAGSVPAGSVPVPYFGVWSVPVPYFGVWSVPVPYLGCLVGACPVLLVRNCRPWPRLSRPITALHPFIRMNG
jgi:hypothetical protein